ncbi:MAG: DNA-directed RNA polymerase subunit omega [Peptococcaceae bacterium]|nr:DNA-directed RNA polymerase subunit omega [Peptococcaceae bacterium]
MMQHSIDVLLEKADSKYTLVVAAAKRARAITEDPSLASQVKGQKPVTQAFSEIAAGKIVYERLKSGIK